jgi:hypothetical protein
MNLLKQGTAAILKLGPFVDSGDGVTPETGLSIGQGDIQISKNGGAFAQTSEGAPTTTHDADGWYPIPLTATDTGTLGRLVVQVAMSGALPVWWEGLVVPANVYDSLVAGSDVLTADVTQIGGVAQSATDLKDFADAGYDPSSHKVQGVVLVDTTTTNTDMRGTDNASTLDAAGVRNAVGLASANLDTQLDAIPTVGEIDTELTSSHGSGAWTSGAAGSGDVTVTSATLDDAGDTMVFETGAGAGIPDAQVRAYITSEYDAGNYSNVVAISTTLADGSWGPIYLNAGIKYTIVFSKTGYAIATTTITPEA